MSETTAVNAGEAEVQGYVAPNYEGLLEAFRRNFRELGEIGGSFSVMVDGQLVADLWGGWKDREKTVPWEHDTIACVWSTSKGIGAVCFAMLVDRGLASYEDKVSTYWPEFAAEDKGDVTIGMLVSHQAGITGFASHATLDDLFAGEAAAQRLAAQAPLWRLGTASGYSNVVGILETALFKRIEGRSIKQFVAEELKGAFGLDLSVGLDARDKPRVADLLGGDAMDALNTIPMSNDAQRAVHNPPMRGDMANQADFQAADIVAANGYTNARALAAMYGMLLHRDSNGRRLVGDAALREASKLRFDGIDLVRGVRRPWAAGFLLNEEHVWGPNKEAFGHGGWGGSFAFADPVAGVSVGYTMNLMSDQMDLNPRRRGLIDAVYAALETR
ncbi:serine hydrolase domain-containing protein [Paraburkholderia sp. BR10937]|uniref:serine hydrolase domain-containing protein n=1 Tax=Paraburkholderia sp. BR10937 TaxID=3236994 RepID=UPI0034D1A52F